MDADERTYRVDLMTRVEGEGRFLLRVRDGVVERAELSIFEAPRFFEALLRGRSIDEVPDIVARICGICPVAYQMSAVRALEAALGVQPTPEIRRLRRLLYCGEWIESHALHVFLLHAPDFLGYESAVEMAADHRPVVEMGLRMKRAGNALIELLGGRAIHPISVRVGGFSRAPARSALAAHRDALARGLEDALAAVAWAAGLEAPDFEQDYVFVALDADVYPLEEGRGIRISDGTTLPEADFETRFGEVQVPHSNALQCRMLDGRAYLTGPIARLALHAERLHPRAREAWEGTGMSLPVRNPYLSMVVRCVELVHAFAEALDLLDGYRGAEPSAVPWEAADAVGYGATEAPRGLLWHRYAVRADGTVAEAKIVPPTSQNQARIEEDLASIGPELAAMEHGAATRRCEQLVRAYDPCISCATHFLELDLGRE